MFPSPPIYTVSCGHLTAVTRPIQLLPGTSRYPVWAVNGGGSLPQRSIIHRSDGLIHVVRFHAVLLKEKGEGEGPHKALMLYPRLPNLSANRP